MKQLTLGDILEFAEMLKKETFLTEEDIKALPVYIGDDDELNGIHCGWNCSIVDADDECDADIVEMINERRGNYKLIGRDSAILIS